MQRKEKKETASFKNNYDVNISFESSPCSFPAHWHVFTEFVLATKDHCIYSINGKHYEINQGDLLFFWPTEVHEVISTPPHASLILQFDSSLISGSRDLNSYRYSLQNRHFIKAKEHKSLALHLGECMEKCNEIYFSNDPFIETKIKIQIYNMLTTLGLEAINTLATNQDSTNATSASYIKINNACNYISEHCERDLPQEEVADFIGFSRFHFARLFKEYTSITFVQFLTKQRLQRAIELLGNRNLSITNIAYQAGFQSISNFNRVFKEVKGCSPKDYRKLYYYNLAETKQQILLETSEQ